MRILTILAVALACLAAGAPGRSAEKLSPIPFDPDLSIYAAQQGAWRNHVEVREERAEIEAPVAAFPPNEACSDSPGIWAVHQVNLPSPPDGWVLYDPYPEREMHLKVIVHDARRRLGKLVIRDWDTGKVIDTVGARKGGGELLAFPAVPLDCECFRLDVRDRRGALLFGAGAIQSAARACVVVSKTAGWQPNRGRHHPCSDVPEGPCGDPMDGKGKRLTDTKPVTVSGCNGWSFSNDDPNGTYRYLGNMAWHPRNLAHGTPPDMRSDTWVLQLCEEVKAAVARARAPYAYAGQAYLRFPEFHPLPYSCGTVHFPMELTASAEGIIAFPYRGRARFREEIEREVDARVSLQGVAGSESVSGFLASSVKLTAEERKRWQILPPLPVGDVWGVRVLPKGEAFARPNEPIPGKLTLQLETEAVTGYERPRPVGGIGTLKRKDAATEPAPPDPGRSEWPLRFASGGDAVGLATVEVPKGWNYEATGVPEARLFGPGVGSVHGHGQGFTYHVTCRLHGARVLNIVPRSPQEVPLPAWVELERRVEGGLRGWELVDSGETTRGRGGPFAYGFVCHNVEPGTYRARGCAFDGEWGPWAEITIGPPTDSPAPTPVRYLAIVCPPASAATVPP